MIEEKFKERKTGNDKNDWKNRWRMAKTQIKKRLEK